MQLHICSSVDEIQNFLSNTYSKCALSVTLTQDEKLILFSPLRPKPLSEKSVFRLLKFYLGQPRWKFLWLFGNFHPGMKFLLDSCISPFYHNIFCFCLFWGNSLVISSTFWGSKVRKVVQSIYQPWLFLFLQTVSLYQH